MAVIHISEADAVHNLPALLAQVRAGAEIVIDSDEAPIAIRRATEVTPTRTEPMSLPAAIRWAKKKNSDVLVDENFKSDMEAIVRQTREVKPRLASEILADLERDGSTALLPDGFAEATEEGIRALQNERLGDQWEFS